MAIIENLDNIREKATEAAKAAAKKTKQLAEIAKTNISIYSQEDQIKKAYHELGKLFYRDYVVGEERDETEYLPLCRQIDEAKQSIADLRDYIDEIKAGRVDMNVDDIEEEEESDTEPEQPACLEAATEE